MTDLVIRETCRWCGGVIVVPANASWEIKTAAVQRHQRLAMHREARFGASWLAHREISR